MSMRTIFVSHAHADNALCDRYVSALRDRGFDIWYDRSDLQGGSQLSASIQRELRERSAFVVFLTPASVSSFWVQLETDAYRALMVQDETRMMLPVRLQPCDVPVLLEPLTWIDAVGQPFDQTIDAMARALETDPTARTPVPLGRGRARVGGLGGLGAALIAVVCVVLLAAVLLTLGISGRIPFPGRSFPGGTSSPFAGVATIPTNYQLPCSPAPTGCAQARLYTTLVSITIDATKNQTLALTWTVSYNGPGNCDGGVALYGQQFQDPTGQTIGGQDVEQTGIGFLASGQTVTRHELFYFVPQPTTQYTFFARIHSRCASLFFADNDFFGVFNFAKGYSTVEVYAQNAATPTP